MKFGATLKQHRVEEWRTGYINYRLLKKQIAKAAQELDAIDDGDLEENRVKASSRQGSSARDATTTSQPEQATANNADPGSDTAHRRLKDNKNSSTTSSHQPGNDTRRRVASMPMWKHGSTDPITVPKASSSLRKSAVIDDHGIIVGSPTESDGSNAIDAPTDRIVRETVSRRRDSTASLRSHQSHQSTSSVGLIRRLKPTRNKSSAGLTGLTPAGDFNPRKWRKPFSNAMSLEKVYELCPSTSKRFIDTIEGELARVAQFYESREADAVRRFEELSAQWQELQDHKKDFQAFRAREMQPPQVLNPIFQRMSAIPGSTLVRRTLVHRAPPKTKGTLPYVPREDQAKKRNLVHGRPEEYISAKAKLKLATFEYYRFLGMLKSYRVLNRTGFAKATKKFEKATKIPCSAKFSARVDETALVTSEKLEDLIKETENVFAAAFEHGDRKKALDRLRNFGAQRSHHFEMWRAGVLIGAAIPLLVEGIVHSAKPATHAAIPYWVPLLQLWGSFFLPILFSLFFYFNILAWRSARINHVLIFELDVRNRIDTQQYLEIPAIIFFIASILFWATFSNFWPEAISPTAYPLAFLIVAVVLMLMPLPILYPSARWWMLRSFSRMATGGLVRVEFRDFFLGDELNSLYYTWPDNTQEICSVNKSWASPVLAALPAGWRLGQSLRRYLDSDGLLIHLLNAGKYSASIIQFFFYYTWRIYGSPRNWRMGLWILFAVINSVYTSSWDILMDWSLLRKDSRHYMLRNNLAFFKDSPWMYYVAIVFNVLTRFAWVIYLAPDSSLTLKGYIVALVEASRRIVWNSFRVESEHIGNVDGYRATRNVELPYTSVSSASPLDGSTDDLQSDDEETFAASRNGTEGAIGAGPATGATRLSRKLVRFFKELKDDIARDFAPLASIHLLVMGKRQDAERRMRERKESVKRRQRKSMADDSSGEDGEGEEGEGDDDEQYVVQSSAAGKAIAPANESKPARQETMSDSDEEDAGVTQGFPAFEIEQATMPDNFTTTR
ncbi:Xenotropic and polytropic retrovirus receptor 1 [Microbotryomycetes sp. JL221]|nr:Xenotropic and polytropic retrovirus receptor 1 [Microbotryomycetes sp. JL221]